MSKRVFIVHGWDGYPEEGWFPWIKSELESRGFFVMVPQMPKPEEPRINNWVPALADAVGTADEGTYFIGHSMGNQAIARYLSELPGGMKIGGAVFVAGFFKRLTNLEDDGVVRDVVHEWLGSPIDLKKVKTHLGQSVAIFSDDDKYVPLDNQEEFREMLGSKIVVEHAMGHFSGSAGTKELPSALEALLEISN